VNKFRHKVFCGLEGLLEFYDIWNRTVQEDEETDITHHPIWYKVFFSTVEKNSHHFYFITLWEDENKLLAVVPLKTSLFKYFGISLKSIELPFHEELNYRDIYINKQADKDEIVKQIWEVLYSFNQKWDVFVCLYYHSPSYLSGLLNSFPGKFKLAKESSRIDYIESSGYQALMDSKSKKFCRNLSRLDRKIHSEKKVDFIYEETEGTVNNLFYSFLELEASGWKGKKGKCSAILCNRDLTDYYIGLMNEKDTGLKFDVNILKADNNCIGGLLGVIYKDLHYSIKIAYNQDYCEFSPGQILYNYSLKRHLDDMSLKSSNFMSGFNWQIPWRTGFFPTYNGMFFKNSAKAFFVFLLVISVCKLKMLSDKIKPILKKENQN